MGVGGVLGREKWICDVMQGDRDAVRGVSRGTREAMRRRVLRGLMPDVTRVGILRTRGRSSKTQGVCDDNCDSPFRRITIWVVGGERRAFSHVRAFVIW